MKEADRTNLLFIISIFILLAAITIVFSSCSVRMFNSGTETSDRHIKVEKDSILVDLGLPTN